MSKLNATQSQSNTNAGALFSRGLKAAKATVEHHGYTVLDTLSESSRSAIHLVAKDASDIVFVSVRVKTVSADDCTMPPENVNRSRFEQIAAKWIATSDKAETGFNIRFDVLSILICGDDKALVRRHVNAFGAVED